MRANPATLFFALLLPAQTPLDRLSGSKPGKVMKVHDLKEQRSCQDPFQLATTIERKIAHIWDLANPKQSPHGNHKDG